MRVLSLKMAVVAALALSAGCTSSEAVGGNMASRTSGLIESESYAELVGSPFLTAQAEPLSTFSIDVDTASYSNIRRFLNDNRLPPSQAVRVEEMVNYFSYGYDSPSANEPIAVHTELAACSWNEEHQLMLVGLQAKRYEPEAIPPRNLIFLLDVSGSMADPSKLRLIKRSMMRLTRELRPEDSIGIVTYSNKAVVQLKPRKASDTSAILDVISSLSASGSTNGAGGIQMAYELARKHFDAEGVNRVILATDGDFNVGVSSLDELEALITAKRDTGVYLTVVGVGAGNLKDDAMELLADKGNGHYVYLDSSLEARKVFSRAMGAGLVTVADDVKIQVEFNPAHVHSYRLLGYENRMLAARDFNDADKDAGEMGAGHSVTALYEIVPAGSEGVDPLRYQPAKSVVEAAGPHKNEVCLVKVAYKEPGGGEQQRMTHIVEADSHASPSSSFRFASAVAGFGLLLRGSDYGGRLDFALVQRLAADSLGHDDDGDRHEFLRLVQLAEDLAE